MNRGKVVLCPFPFTDMSGHKVRPAVVVSRSDRSDTDCMLAFVTTKIAAASPADLVLDDSHGDFLLTGLKKSSLVRLDKLVTLEQSLLLGELGEISDSLLGDLDDRLRYSLEL